MFSIVKNSITQLAEVGNYENVTKIDELIVGTGEILHDCSVNRERPWVEKKKGAVRLADLYVKARIDDPNVISEGNLSRLKSCASYVIFNQCPNHSEEKHLKQSDFCRNRLCPMCNWRKSLKMFSQMTDIVDKVIDDTPDIRFVFVTLTIKNTTGDKLSETIDSMNKAFKLMTDKTKTLAVAKKFKKYMLGFFKAFEVTYNMKKNTYHPHLHVVFAVKPSYFSEGYINQKNKEWTYLWKECLGIDYEPVVDVKNIKNLKQKGAICEVAKYATKGEYLKDNIPEEKAVDAVKSLTWAFKNRRLISFAGIFRDARKQLRQDDIEDGDLINITDEIKDKSCKICGTQLEECLYKFSQQFGLYIN